MSFVRWFRLTALLLLVEIVLSPLRAVAATIPVLFAYDVAVPPTPTMVGGYGAVRSEAERPAFNDYDSAHVEYDDRSNPHVAAGAGAVHAYDGALNLADRPSNAPAMAGARCVHAHDDALELLERRELAKRAIYGFVEPRTAAEATALHHPWPKYLGGAVDQDLVPLAKSVHEAFHAGLDRILPRQWGTAYYEGLSAAAKEQVVQDLAAYTQAFDAKYGTTIYESMLANGFPAR